MYTCKVCQTRMSITLFCDRLPEDVEQLERLNSAMSNLATDNDRDVAGKARGLNDLFKKTPVRLFSNSVHACICIAIRTEHQV